MSVIVQYALGGKYVYRAGDRISGKVIVDLTLPTPALAVRIFLEGQACVKLVDHEMDFKHYGHAVLPDIKSKDVFMKEQYLSAFITPWRAASPSVYDCVLQPGEHIWAFSFQLPQGPLPSSFEGKHGAIRYWLKVLIERPPPQENRESFLNLTVLDNLNMNEPQYLSPTGGSYTKTVSKRLGFGKAGELKMDVKMDRCGYCPGESIAILATLENNSTKDMGRFKARLIQKIKYVVGETKEKKETTMESIQTRLQLLKGKTLRLEWDPLPVGLIPPSSVPSSCNIIRISYYVKMFIEVPFGLDLVVNFPITIGTVPRGYRTELSAPSPDLSPVVHTKCTKEGEDVFDGRIADFPMIPFTPMVAHVPNFRFVEPRTATASAK